MTLEERLEQSKYEIVVKKTHHIQRKDLKVGFLFDFYLKPENHNVVLKIYDNKRYVGTWGRWNALAYQDNESIEYDLCNFIYDQEIDSVGEEVDIQYIDNLFLRFYKTTYIAIKEKESREYAAFITLRDASSVIANVRKNVKSILCQKNVMTWTIGIPGEFVGDKGEEGNCSIFDKLFWIEERKESAIEILRNITDINYEEAKNEFNGSIDEEINVDLLDVKKPKLFLVGPCIVNGNIHMKGDRLIDLLEKDADEYQIVKVVEWERMSEKLAKILEYDIRENDIVVFIEDKYDEKYIDIDMNEIFTKTISEKWLYTNVMVHTTRYGNELIISEILNKILNPIREKEKNVFSDKILHEKELQWITADSILSMKRYIKEIRESVSVSEGTIGAIVMNANPFTNGHKYLVEYASKQVEFLYVFVVEEDMSAIPFSVRMQLVKEGTRDIKNLSVVRSGQFIISKDTFQGYFKKETIAAIEVDVTKDVHVFGNVIAKALGITKRFVGEEPFDAVTQKYNESMKEILPKYGVELIEIPRKESPNGVISATKVRKYYQDKDWETMRLIVPQTTYEFLYQHQDDLETMRTPYIDMIKENELKRIRKWLSEHENIVIYGIGRNIDSVISLISDNCMDKIRFCDEQAKNQTIYFMKKRVISPDELTNKDNILISSTKYGKEIFGNLRKQGLAYEQIFNFSVFALR